MKAAFALPFSRPGAIIARERGENMITEFTERRPVLSTVLVVLLFTVVPGAFMFIVKAVTGSGGDAAMIIFVYALVLQFILWLKVERPILIMLPFIMSLLAFIVSEIVYTVSESAAPIGQGPSPLAFFFSSALVTLFGTIAAASIGGLILYAVIVIFRKVRELIIYR